MNETSNTKRESDLIVSVDRLDREVREVYRALVLPRGDGELRGLPDTLYGYMMGVFARLDLASAYWKGSYSGDQTKRMVGFMDAFFRSSPEVHWVAVKMWRHKLMHTSGPRVLRRHGTGVLYKWLLHWWKELPEEQHFTFSETGNSRILNLSLVYLVRDLKAAVQKFQTSLHAGSEAFRLFKAVEQKLSNDDIV